MGTFVFKWDHPASEVYVTGTFDEWKKTVKLDKAGEHFEKEVKLSDASEKILYKFVVDGDWVIDHTAPKEADKSGNENNVLTPDRIIREAPATAAIMNSVAPDSTTAALAAEAPLETKEEKPADLPGAFPETPAAEIGINPMPAADGAVNPIKLAPGEKIPESLTAENTNSNVKLDQNSYEKADELPGGTTAILSSAAPDSTTAALAASAPIETPAATLSSAAPDSTTAALAADAPIETKVPEVVKESQEKADSAPEASAIPEEVQEKAAVETELLEKVKEAPSTSEGTAGQGAEKTENAVSPGEAAASVAAAVTAIGTAAVENVAAQIPVAVKEKLPESIQKAIDTSAKEQKIEEVSPEVPAEVKESMVEAGKAPEAAANTEAVEDKKAVESELLKEVKPVEAVGEESKMETTESKPAQVVDKAVQKVEETVGAASKTEPETTPAAETNGANGAQASNGAQTTGEASKPAEAAVTTEKKKKNRLSTMFSKIKSKLNK